MRVKGEGGPRLIDGLIPRGIKGHDPVNRGRPPPEERIRNGKHNK